MLSLIFWHRFWFFLFAVLVVVANAIAGVVSECVETGSLFLKCPLLLGFLYGAVLGVGRGDMGERRGGGISELLVCHLFPPGTGGLS